MFWGSNSALPEGPYNLNKAFPNPFTETISFNTGNTNGWTTEDILEVSGALTDGNFVAGDQVVYDFIFRGFFLKDQLFQCNVIEESLNLFL